MSTFSWSNFQIALQKLLDDPSELSSETDISRIFNEGQRRSLEFLKETLPRNGVLVADDVGMGKTRIAVIAARAVIAAGGRVAVVAPGTLGFQWQEELRCVRIESKPMIRGEKEFLARNLDDQFIPDEPLVIFSQGFGSPNYRGKGKSDRLDTIVTFAAHVHNFETHGSGKVRHWGDYEHAEVGRKIYHHYCGSGATPKSTAVFKAVQAEKRFGEFEKRDNYKKHGPLRQLQNDVLSLGIGEFDLVIVDEAHKSRGDHTMLSNLLNNILATKSGEQRMFCMTATPIELDVSQWSQILQRTGAGATLVSEVQDAAAALARSLDAVRAYPNDPKITEEFEVVSSRFETLLKNSLIRRAKRSEGVVRDWYLSSNGRTYRRTHEIAIDPQELSSEWRQMLCAAESLSLMNSRHVRADAAIKRARLTIANGHGFSALSKLDRELMEADELETSELRTDADIEGVDYTSPLTEASDSATRKAKQRMEFWTSRLSAISAQDPEAIRHPAMEKVCDKIFEIVDKGEKVLVFGTFRGPLQTLTRKINARAIVESFVADDGNQAPPRSSVPEELRAHVECELKRRNPNLSDSEIELQLTAIDDFLRTSQRERLRLRRDLIENLHDRLMKGIKQLGETPRLNELYLPVAKAFIEASSAEQELRSHRHDDDAIDHSIPHTSESEATLTQRGFLGATIATLLGNDLANADDKAVAEAFFEVFDANYDPVMDQNADGKLDENEPHVAWSRILAQLKEDFGKTGDFAREMNGSSKPGTRKLLQRAFNREDSALKVLVAQSAVGREGLNLHLACRSVILVHAEWNPGVVEQQIGRVDRLASLWERKFREFRENASSSEVPCIDVYQVIFRGTYDEYHWSVLQRRIRELNAQLQGIIIDQEPDWTEEQNANAVRINSMAPNFSP